MIVDIVCLFCILIVLLLWFWLPLWYLQTLFTLRYLKITSTHLCLFVLNWLCSITTHNRTAHKTKDSNKESTKKHNTEQRYEPRNPPKNTTQKTKDMSHGTWATRNPPKNWGCRRISYFLVINGRYKTHGM